MIDMHVTMFAYSSEIKVDVERYHAKPVLTIRAAGGDFTLFISEENLAALTEVLTEDQDTRPIECGTCKDGVVVIGQERDTMMQPGDPIEVKCPVCHGDCTVEAIYFRDDLEGIWPDADDVRDGLENDAETMQLSKGGQ